MDDGLGEDDDDGDADGPLAKRRKMQYTGGHINAMDQILGTQSRPQIGFGAGIKALRDAAPSATGYSATGYSASATATQGAPAIGIWGGKSYSEGKKSDNSSREKKASSIFGRP